MSVGAVMGGAVNLNRNIKTGGLGTAAGAQQTLQSGTQAVDRFRRKKVRGEGQRPFTAPVQK